MYKSILLLFVIDIKVIIAHRPSPRAGWAPEPNIVSFVVNVTCVELFTDLLIMYWLDV